MTETQVFGTSPTLIIISNTKERERKQAFGLWRESGFSFSKLS
jgi:hypothetical protein